MPLEHIKHVLKPYMHDCPSMSTGLVFYPKKVDVYSGGIDAPRQTMGDGVVGGRHKTDVMRDWEWKGRKRGNMIENEASTGFEAWMGFAFLARRQDLTWGIHQSISTGRPNFLFLGGLRLLRIISKIGICDFFSLTGRAPTVSLKYTWKIILQTDICGDYKT